MEDRPDQTKRGSKTYPGKQKTATRQADPHRSVPAEAERAAKREAGTSDADLSAWAPLRRPVYRRFWIASLISNLGTWMHEVGAGWLMTDLDASPQMVSAVRTAMATPIVLLAIPAGVLADRVDRRRLLLATQWLMLLATAVLATLTAAGTITSWMLLALTFVIGLGLTVHVPSWQATTPELVPRVQLSRAIALGSISFNLARAIGPAIAGALVALTGVWIAFSFNALSFAGVIVVLMMWKREPTESTRGLSFGLSLYQGLRYVYRNVAMRHVLIRVIFFLLPASALWALLPLVARQRMGWGADGFGLLVACIGGGAVVAARFLPYLKRRLGRNMTVCSASVVFGLGMMTIASSTRPWLVVGAALVMGGGWMITLTSLNTAAQMSLADRMRARGMSCYLTAMALSMSSGAYLWGEIASGIGIGGAQKIAATTVLVGAAMGMLFSVTLPAKPGRRERS